MRLARLFNRRQHVFDVLLDRLPRLRGFVANVRSDTISRLFCFGTTRDEPGDVHLFTGHDRVNRNFLTVDDQRVEHQHYAARRREVAVKPSSDACPGGGIFQLSDDAEDLRARGDDEPIVRVDRIHNRSRDALAGVLNSYLFIECNAQRRASAGDQRNRICLRLRRHWLTDTKSDAEYRDDNKATEFQRSEEHTSELQSLTNLVCRLLLEKKKNNKKSLFNECLTKPECIKSSGHPSIGAIWATYIRRDYGASIYRPQVHHHHGSWTRSDTA